MSQYPPYRPPGRAYSPSAPFGDSVPPFPPTNPPQAPPREFPPFYPTSLPQPPQSFRPYDAYAPEPPRPAYPYEQPRRSYETDTYDPYLPATNAYEAPLRLPASVPPRVEHQLPARAKSPPRSARVFTGKIRRDPRVHPPHAPHHRQHRRVFHYRPRPSTKSPSTHQICICKSRRCNRAPPAPRLAQRLSLVRRRLEPCW